jgi:hypothetical protein
MFLRNFDDKITTVHDVKSTTLHGVKSTTPHGVKSTTLHGVKSATPHGVKSTTPHDVKTQKTPNGKDNRCLSVATLKYFAFRRHWISITSLTDRSAIKGIE